MRIRLAEELNNHPRDCIASDKAACQHAGVGANLLGPPHDVEDDKQHQPFQECFVELAGMTRFWTAVWEHHAPRRVSDPAIKLTIDKVGDPPKEKSNGRGAGQHVAQNERR